jgi:hypothetical protein
MNHQGRIRHPVLLDLKISNRVARRRLFNDCGPRFVPGNRFRSSDLPEWNREAFGVKAKSDAYIAAAP